MHFLLLEMSLRTYLWNHVFKKNFFLQFYKIVGKIVGRLFNLHEVLTEKLGYLKIFDVQYTIEVEND